MAIEELTAVVSPPGNPIETGSDEQWDAVQKSLGIQLPFDFKGYGHTYGTGFFKDKALLIRIYQPFWSRYESTIRVDSQWLLEYKRNNGDDYIPYNIFPDSPGLLYWGSDDAGKDLFWMTDGRPDNWPVVTRSDCDEWQFHDLPFTSFLAKAFTRQIQVDIWKPQFYFSDPKKIEFRNRSEPGMDLSGPL